MSWVQRDTHPWSRPAGEVVLQDLPRSPGAEALLDGQEYENLPGL
jgi:hypothetical protein